MRSCLIVSALFLSLGLTGQGNERSLLAEARLKASDDTTAKPVGSAVEVTVAPGKNDYPGVGFAPPNGAWDLSRFGHVEARLVNTGAKPIILALRVDNAGNWQDNPWNTESITLEPGQASTVRTIFGYQYGQKKGYKLDPSKVSNVLIFTTKSDAARSFRIESIVAAGPAHETPPVALDDLRTKPTAGVIFDLKTSPNVAFESGDKNGLTFPAGKPDAIARIKPRAGRWDLRDYTEVHVTLRNSGSVPVVPRVRLESNGGAGEWRTVAKSMDPGAEAEIVALFGHPIDVTGGAPSDLITSDAVSAVAFSIVPSGQDAHIQVTRIVAVAKPAAIPAWLGKRPPVPGEWVKTLNQEFEGNKLDTSVWKVTGENYYDKQTHWSKDDVIVKDGMLRVRYEKQTGFHNDDPKRNSTPYAAGYLDTYGLWAQRYGYFEARMKLPKAPGLWPAFWMMPDRGSKAGPEQWKRSDTGNGAMEFDIMEHLTRWGAHRYNIAMHYDGYEAAHKAIGSDKVYVEADKDGFIICGLLWTPGEAVYYCNGRELLRWKNPRISNVPSYLMFTLPSGGWDNDAVDDDRLPADLIVDYVRVWQRKDLASPGDGKRIDP
ncbi:glycoside hydrolase family 16 protein [Fimbriimonas ginsengisoli]|uniref:Glycoside hydrolase family 16 n=1 Tax=Fimbriimonas ginsengisoli Gsoil 348 TaxID=661478 RepID=A0A068NT27_FIMGI|nr:glycoside hydrolase family 16 protein [Fimbriimonas ginsengisoli]AIE86502.1 glycoside hydrolase family 16 [Fimbriimonas ginsengisoli Gsoil 348]